jgi:hypothetical protein
MKSIGAEKGEGREGKGGSREGGGGGQHAGPGSCKGKNKQFVYTVRATL